MVDVFCSIFKKFTPVEAKAGFIIAEDDAYSFQVEYNEQFVSIV